MHVILFFSSETQLGGDICDRIQSSVKQKITCLLELFLDRNRLLHALQVSIGIQHTAIWSIGV